MTSATLPANRTNPPDEPPDPPSGSRDSGRNSRLEASYAKWLPFAIAKLVEAERLGNACNQASWHKQGAALLEDRPKLFEIGPLVREAAIAATEVLLIEDDPVMRQRVEELTKLPLVPNGLGGRHHAEVVALHAAISNRRREAEAMVEQVRERLRR